MAKKKPAGTVTHQIFLSAELHKKVTTLTTYGEADSLIVTCVEEGIAPRWKKWLEQETNKLRYDPSHEGGQKEIRRDSGQADKSGTTKAIRNKARRKTT